MDKTPEIKGTKLLRGGKLFPFVFAIDFFDIQTFRNILVTSRAAKFALGEIPFFFPPKAIRYGDSTHIKILTLGDGNLSFSFSLAHFLKTYLSEINFQLMATTYDSYNDLIRKYPETKQIVAKLLKLGCRVKHSVDATSLNNSVLLPAFDRYGTPTPPSSLSSYSHIFFMHPHLGVEDCQLHGLFLAHFFASCSNVCNNGDSLISGPHTEILLSLVSGQAERWRLFKRIKKAGLKCIDTTSFKHEKFFGYEVKRTNTGKSFKNVSTKKHVQTAQRSFMYRLIHKDAQVKRRYTWKRCNRGQRDISDSMKPSTRDSMYAEANTCTICNKSFSTKQGLKTHTHTVHVLKLFDTSKRYHCVSCSRVFNSKDAHMQHCIAKHGASARPLKIADAPKKAIDSTTTLVKSVCNICEQTYTGTYEDHLSMFRPNTFARMFVWFITPFFGKFLFSRDSVVLRFCEIKQEKTCSPAR
eukprot:g4318.t1